MILAKANFQRWYHPTKPLLLLNCIQTFGFGYPFLNDATVMPDARLDKIRSVFHGTRMCIDPEALMTADSASNVTTTELDARITEIITGIERRSARGHWTLVDMHFHGAAVSISSGWQYTDVFDLGTKAARFGFVLARLGQRMHNGCSSGKAALEMFNEPPAVGAGGAGAPTTAEYITQLRAWWAQLRAAMPRHTILVGGNNLNALDSLPAGGVSSGLTALTASHYDINTCFTFHQYEPGLVTHQGVDGTLYQYAHDVKFPSSANVSAAAVKSAFTAATVSEGDHDGVVAADANNAVVTQTAWSTSVDEFYATYGTKALLATRQGVTTTWSDAASIGRKRLMHTETGVNFGSADRASEATAAAYLQAQVENAVALGLGCICIHEMQDGGATRFGIQDSSTPWAFNPTIEAALVAGLGA